MDANRCLLLPLGLGSWRSPSLGFAKKGWGGSRGCFNPDRNNACWRCSVTGHLARSRKAKPRRGGLTFCSLVSSTNGLRTLLGFRMHHAGPASLLEALIWASGISWSPTRGSFGWRWWVCVCTAATSPPTILSRSLRPRSSPLRRSSVRLSSGPSEGWLLQLVARVGWGPPIGNENYHRGQRGARVAKQIWPAVVYIFLQLYMDKFIKNM